MTRMLNPPHLGLTLRDDVLPALGVSVTEGCPTARREPRDIVARI